MVGPLLYQELLLGGRRSREHIIRWLYAAWLLLMVAFYTVQEMGNLLNPFTDGVFRTPAVCQQYTDLFIKQHFFLVMLATPAFVAGGVTDEKTRGTLQYLLTTDLTSVHIIVGKLLGRIVQVLALAMVGLPLFGFLGALGGVEPALFFSILILTVEVVVGVAAATFLAAVWSRQTRDAVLGFYFVLFLLVALAALIAGPVRALWPMTFLDSLVSLVSALMKFFNPLYILEPVLIPGDQGATKEILRRLLAALFAWGGLAAGCVSLAAWRLRPAYIRQLEGEGRKRPTWWRPRRREVDEEPVRWRERNVEGLAPLPFLRRVPRWMGIFTISSATIATSLLILWTHLAPGVTPVGILEMLTNLEFEILSKSIIPADEAFLAQSILSMLFFALLVGIRCSGAVSGERERQTWEAILLTPLTASQLIRGKLWGITLASYVYLLAYAIPALFLSALGGLMASVWTILWLLVSMLSMYYMGAAGIWASVRAKSSWRSLLTTFCIGYVGGFVIYLITTPVILIIAMMITAILALVDRFFFTNLATTVGGFMAQYWTGYVLATCLGLAFIFWITARLFLNSAQRWVADRERTRHWHDEPMRRTRRRISQAPQGR